MHLLFGEASSYRYFDLKCYTSDDTLTSVDISCDINLGSGIEYLRLGTLTVSPVVAGVYIMTQTVTCNCLPTQFQQSTLERGHDSSWYMKAILRAQWIHQLMKLFLHHF